MSDPVDPVIYLAAPLFNDRERAYNAALAAAIEPVCPVFLPQRDGALLVDMLAAGVPLSVAERRVFLQDCAAMKAAPILVAVLDGAHVDEGVAFEIGFMAALGKVCVGLQSDVRRALPSGNNPMLQCSLESVFASQGELLSWLKDQHIKPSAEIPRLAG